MTTVKSLHTTPMPAPKGAGGLSPKLAPSVKSKSSGSAKVKTVLRKIRECLAENTDGMTRDQKTENRVRALALALGLIERANTKDNKGTRNALVKEVRALKKERAAQRPAKLLLQVVKVCFPKAKISDQSQYTRFIAACLIEDWSSGQVLKRFIKRRAKSRERNARLRSADKKYAPAVGIKEFAKRGNVLLKNGRLLRLKLPVLFAALMK